MRGMVILKISRSIARKNVSHNGSIVPFTYHDHNNAFRKESGATAKDVASHSSKIPATNNTGLLTELTAFFPHNGPSRLIAAFTRLSRRHTSTAAAPPRECPIVTTKEK